MKFFQTFEKYIQQNQLSSLSLETVETMLKDIKDDEWLFAFDKNGNQVYHEKGDHYNVGISDDSVLPLIEAGTVTHNHPMEDKDRFSIDDIEHAVKWKIKELRLVTRTGAFSVTAPTGIIADYLPNPDYKDLSKLMTYYTQEELEHFAELEQINFEAESHKFQEIYLTRKGLVYKVVSDK